MHSAHYITTFRWSQVLGLVLGVRVWTMPVVFILLHVIRELGMVIRARSATFFQLSADHLTFPSTSLLVVGYCAHPLKDSVHVRYQPQGDAAMPGHLDRRGAGDGQRGEEVIGVRHVACHEDRVPVLHGGIQER